MKKTVVILMLLTVCSKFLGFAREMILSYYYGASSISDAYLISLTIPTVVFSIIATGIVTGYIPIYSEIESKRADANRFTNNTLNFVLAISLVIIVLVIICAAPLVKLFASGFEGETLRNAVRFTQISIFGIFFSGICYIFKGYLQSNNKYYAPALIGLPFNFFIITSIFLSTKYELIVLPIGIVIAEISQIILLLPFMYRKGYKFKFILDFKDKYLNKIMFLSLPVILGTSVDQINKLIDRTIASQISVGGISALNYSNRLNGFIFEIFILSVATVMYPLISKLAADRDIAGLKRAVLHAITSINIFIVPATLGIMVFARPIVSLLYARGAFDNVAVEMTSSALFFYSIGMIGIGFREVMSRAFYSIQDTKTPMINAMIAILLNITLNIILSQHMGIAGLALATSISTIFCSLLLFISLRKKIGALGIKEVLYKTVKVMVAAIIMILIVKIVFENLIQFYSSNLAFLLIVPVGLVTYGILIYFLKIEEAEALINGIKKRFKGLK